MPQSIRESLESQPLSGLVLIERTRRPRAASSDRSPAAFAPMRQVLFVHTEVPICIDLRGASVGFEQCHSTTRPNFAPVRFPKLRQMPRGTWLDILASISGSSVAEARDSPRCPCYQVSWKRPLDCDSKRYVAY